MNRRGFLGAGALAAVAGALNAQDAAATRRAPFKLKYAPHFGMFQAHAGKDLTAQLEFMAAEGFRALEDNGLRQRPTEVQDRIGRDLERLGMTMGVFVAHADFGQVTFASSDPAVSKRLVDDVRASVEVARRVRARWCTVVPGRFDPGLEPGYQTANVIDNLRRCCEVAEPAGLVMVLEPLNPWRDHPGLFLTKVPRAFEICRAVNSPSCKILFDVYHQQITEGNLIPNVERSWSEVAYFQVGDNPGRNEPGTGEINYRNVFKAIYARGFAGVVGMEHGNAREGREGERAVIDAYRAADAF
jgi:hydroxypyruvate isomerase